MPVVVFVFFNLLKVVNLKQHNIIFLDSNADDVLGRTTA